MPRADQRDDDLERLLEAGEDAVLRQPERVRLAGPLVPGAETEDEAAAADLVERLGGLGDDAALRWSADSTHVPTLMVVVTAAAPAIETPSQAPWGAPSLARRAARRRPERVEPIDSAAWAILAQVGPARRDALRAKLHVGKHDPDLERAHPAFLLLRGARVYALENVAPHGPGRPGAQPCNASARTVCQRQRPDRYLEVG